ncbi:hypothetical protein MHC_04805 [Mycoplasma haemocanis str. Illinois]|uniref:Uncharacterized protein n=1 Tax=Mycoplasma haemocanis (strain Illinois) TaxID=1111676 RepID=H6N845_MYCHN|nr:hypothetical protein [Mycoplasma haemocanis]AEW45817.1 hypothetical protein MHC_04805 [Mycoplasma haemocanis str. Illinois]
MESSGSNSNKEEVKVNLDVLLKEYLDQSQSCISIWKKKPIWPVTLVIFSLLAGFLYLVAKVTMTS